MKNTFRISTRYWNSLSEKEQMFLKYNAATAGVQRCKRIITLANTAFPNWDDIVDFKHYEGKNLIIPGSHWVVFNKGQILGLIHKVEGLGVTEWIQIKAGQGYKEVWTNYSQRNPPKNIGQISAA